MKRGEIGNRPVERRAVVDARTQHHLRIRLDADVRQPAQLLADVGRGLIAEQVAPQFRLRRVHGDVNRRESLLRESLPVRVGEIGERDEVAVKEAQAIVVVLDVQRLTHALRIAFEEAEEAVVVADLDAVERGILKVDAEILVRIFLDIDGQLLVISQDFERHRLFGGVKLKIDGVAQHVAVDGANAIARAQTRLGGEATAAHRVDDAALVRFVRPG